MVAGRPTKLTLEVTEIICEKLEKGMSYKLACQAARINFTTFLRWMETGESEDAPPEFSDFYNQVRAAEASCAERCLERINAKAEQGSIFCDTWLLERRYPADFGARQHITSDNKNDNNNTNTNVSVDATEEARSSILSKLSPKSTKE